MLASSHSANHILIQAIAIACATTCILETSYADSWNYKANASASWLYNDNPTLRPDDSPLKRDATSYGRVQARGIVEYASARSFADLTTRISTSYYPEEEDSDLEQVNFYLLSNSNYDFMRSGLDMRVRYDNVGLLTDEFGDGVDNGPGGSGSGSTARVDDRVQRFQIAPNYEYQLNEKNRLRFGLGYRIDDYKLEKTNRADNSVIDARLSYNHTINQRWQIGLTATGRKFRSEKLAPIPVVDINLVNSSESTGLTIDVNYQWRVNSGITLSVGQTKTSNERSALDLDDPNVPQVSATESDIKNTLYNLTIFHTGELNSYSINLSRGIVPSSLGVENNQTSVNASLKRRIRENLSATLSIYGYDQQASINSEVTRLNSLYRFISANASLGWNITRSWTISGVYSYRQNANATKGVSSQRGKSNQLGATITYNWD